LKLLLNTFIHRDNTYPYARGYLPEADRLDVLKYTLASYAVIPWTEIHLMVRLDPYYEDRWGELVDFTNELWGDHDHFLLTNKRCEYQPQWKLLTDYYQEQEDPWLWYVCNHDHVFLDYNREALNEVLFAMEEQAEIHPHVGCYFSHWPEILRATQLRGPVTPYRDLQVLKAVWDHMDTIQIVHKDLLHHWWHSRDYGAEKYLPRSDWQDVYKTEPYTCFLPGREIVRHFDGYSHLFNIHDTPPLHIPPGFFEKQMRVKIGYNHTTEGYVNLNPLLPHRVETPSGVDFSGLIEDLPLFWKDRIVEYDVNPNGPSAGAVLEARNNNYLRFAKAPTGNSYCGGFMPDSEWVSWSMR
jgi:hypothetical protein